MCKTKSCSKQPNYHLQYVALWLRPGVCLSTRLATVSPKRWSREERELFLQEIYNTLSDCSSLWLIQDSEAATLNNFPEKVTK